MRVTVLGTRSASTTIRELLSRVVRRTIHRVEVVPRLEIPYWQERGWLRKEHVYVGSYQTPYGAFSGQIHQRGSGNFEFFLYQPSDEIRGHSHWVCFQDRGKEWYLVHMSKQPLDVSSGILTIERLISESYEQA